MKKVIVGLSGGVDSAAVACLLKRNGYEVMGLFVKTFEGASADDAKKVAASLGIELRITDRTSCFKENIINKFVCEYLNGRTPSPCIECNRFIKFDALYEAACDFGADYIATGHYAKTARLANGRITLKQADCTEKDQTYYLYKIPQKILEKTLFPAGNMSKEELRELARGAGIPVADKPDSMELCFVPNDDYKAFIRDHAEESIGKNAELEGALASGNFVNKDGKVLGTHKGIYNYTIGQRKGLGIALGQRGFVVKLDTRKNEVVIGENEDLMTDTVHIKNIFYMSRESVEDGTRAFAKIRYNHKGADCSVFNEETGLRVVFDAPVRAATAGQSLVAYENGGVMFGGEIIC